MYNRGCTPYLAEDNSKRNHETTNNSNILITKQHSTFCCFFFVKFLSDSALRISQTVIVHYTQFSIFLDSILFEFFQLATFVRRLWSKSAAKRAKKCSFANYTIKSTGKVECICQLEKWFMLHEKNIYANCFYLFAFSIAAINSKQFF